jgi:hypothetical protein
VRAVRKNPSFSLILTALSGENTAGHRREERRVERGEAAELNVDGLAHEIPPMSDAHSCRS